MKASLQKAWAQIYGDKKKFTLICGLVLVGLLLWGRLLLKQVPRTAMAKPVTQAAGGARSAALSADGLRGAGQGSAVVLQPQRLTRDLFRADPKIYGSNAPKPRTPTKSAHASTDRQLQIEAVRSAARSLVLQSVIAGQQPRVMINGQVLEIGQSIDGFKVIRMGKRHAVLENNGIKIRLGM